MPPSGNPRRWISSLTPLPSSCHAPAPTSFLAASAPRRRRITAKNTKNAKQESELFFFVHFAFFAIKDLFFSSPQMYQLNDVSAALMERLLAAAWWAAQDRVVEDTNSGAYCRARKKLPAELIAYLVRTIALRAEQSTDLADPLEPEQAEAMLTPNPIANVRSNSISGRVLLVDGFTIDAADTPWNPLARYTKPDVSVVILGPTSAVETSDRNGPMSALICLAQRSTPARENLTIKMSLGPVLVSSVSPAPGSKSTVPPKKPTT